MIALRRHSAHIESYAVNTTTGAYSGRNYRALPGNTGQRPLHGFIHAEKNWVLIAARNDSRTHAGISVFQLLSDGTPSTQLFHLDMANNGPGFLVPSYDHKFLFSANKTSSGQSALSSFKVETNGNTQTISLSPVQISYGLSNSHGDRLAYGRMTIIVD
jgi:hypothetical protein